MRVLPWLPSLGLVLLQACNNYNLKDQLENPGGQEKFTDRLIVFVSSSVTVGNMEALFASGCSGTGIQRADCYCQAKAKEYNRRMNAGSRFVAWLSETGTPVNNTMLCRILGTTGDGCAPAGSFTWYDTSFQPIVSGMSNLFNASPPFSAAIRLTESGNPAPVVLDDVWTGTAQQGTAQPNNCSNWQDATGAIQAGIGDSSAIDFGWTNRSGGFCNVPRRIYCFAIP